MTTTPARLRFPTLPALQQVMLGVGIALVLIGPFFVTGSLVFEAVILAGIVGLAVVLEAHLSIITFILFNALITLSSTGSDRFTLIGIACGSGIIALILVWIVRIRVMESQPLARSTPILLLNLFWIWAAIATGIGVFFGGVNPMESLHDLHNITPLFFLPILYERYIVTDSNSERSIFLCVLATAVFAIVWNLLHFRSTVVAAITLEEVGRGNMDQTVSSLVLLIGVSFLMSARKLRAVIVAGVLSLLGTIGIVVTFRRSLYLASVLSFLPLLALGFRDERRRGALRLSAILGLLSVAMIPVYYSVRVVRLLLLSFGMRFVSSQHVRTDISLLDRYAEWRDAWRAILHSPVSGYGFGGMLRHLILEPGGFHRYQPFTHNSYLYYFFKTGFVGGFLFFSAFVLFIVKGFRLVRSSELGVFHRSVVRAALVHLIVMLIVSLSETYLEFRSALVWIGLIWGYFLALERHLKSTDSLLQIPEASHDRLQS